MENKKIIKIAGIALAASAVTGLAFVAPSMAATANHTNAASSFQTKGGHGHGNGPADNQQQPGQMGGFRDEVSQDVTVTVPDDGATYKLVVTQSANAATTSNTNNNAQFRGMPDRQVVVAVTGTGSVTVSVPGLHPGTYKAELVKVVSSQDLTVAAASGSSAGTTAKK